MEYLEISTYFSETGTKYIQYTDKKELVFS